MPLPADYTSPDLTHLGSTSDDAIVHNLSSRWKHKLPYTRINATTLVAVNPYEVLPILNDASAEQYAEHCYRSFGEATVAPTVSLAPKNTGQRSKDRSGDQHSQHSSLHGSTSLAPHPFELAGKIYLHLRRTGSGKSVGASHIVAQLCRLAAHTKKEARVSSQLQQAQQVLDAFGCVHTAENRNASMFSKFLEIQFNERGRILGAKTLCYLLNSTRITRIPQEESSFHVFYYLLCAHPDSFSDQDKGLLRLHEPFAYINQSKHVRVQEGEGHSVPMEQTAHGSGRTMLSTGMGLDDTLGFDHLKSCMTACGFKPRQMQSMWRLLAAILHLGNVQFTDPAAASKQTSLQEAAIVKNPDVLELISDILGVPGDKLLAALTYKSKLIRRDLCTVVLNAQGSSAHRDLLARTLYTALFGYLVEQINKSLCHAEPANFVAILDQSGLAETPRSFSLQLATFEQFSLNFANEVLHGFLGRRMLDDSVGLNRMQVQDGIEPTAALQRVTTSTIPSLATGNAPFDNSCLQVLVGRQYRDDHPFSNPPKIDMSSTKPIPYSVRIQQQQEQNIRGSSSSAVLGGLVRIMDDSSALYSQGSATDADCLHKATLQLRGDSQSQAIFTTNRASSNYFAIQHFSGKVEYSVDDFLERNLDQISPDFLVLLRNSANKFIVDLFSTEASGAIAVERHPKFEKTIVKAQLQTRPKRQPSRHGGQGGAAGNSSVTARRSLYGHRALDVSAQPPAQDVLGAMMQARQQEEDAQSVSTVLTQVFTTMRDLIQTMDETMLWNMFCLRPNDAQSSFSADTKSLRAQVNAFLLPEIASKKRTEYTVSYTFDEFLKRYERTSLFSTLKLDSTTKTEKGQCLDVANAPGRDWNVRTGQEGPKIALGHTSVWISEDVWKELEDDLRTVEREERLQAKKAQAAALAEEQAATAKARAMELAALNGNNGSGDLALLDGDGDGDPSKLASAHSSTDRLLWSGGKGGVDDGASEADCLEDDIFSEPGDQDDDMTSEYGFAALPGRTGIRRGLGRKTTTSSPVGAGQGGSKTRKSVGEKGRQSSKGKGGIASEKKTVEPVEMVPTTRARKMWVFFTWCMTWWIPSFMLSSCGKMKREDIRMAWREKVALCCIIFFMSSIIIFVITGFGRMMCPGAENLFSPKEVGYHAAPEDFYVSLRGKVYDITKFAKSDHSNGHASYPSDTAYMLPFVGTDVTEYFPLPLNMACYGLVSSPTLAMVTNSTVIGAQVHGPPTSDTTIGWSEKNNQGQWYWRVALPRLLPMKKGELAIEMADIESDAVRKWFVIDGGVYDLTSYYNTIKAPGNTGPQGSGVPSVHFLDKSVEDMAFNHNGEDNSALWRKLPLDSQQRLLTKSCLDQVFYIGKVDYRKSFQCQFTNYMLLSTSVVLVSVIAIKFLAALQLGSVRVPEEHDKFVIVQIPCYTEDEDSLRKTINSIASLRYDDKRKLIFIIADGMIIGSGNELPTPRIVLNLLGADPSLDPEPLAFRSIGDGSKQLNMGKVYSGLHEFEGHVVPYIVVVKVGKPSERSRPGNRGKRDSQIILMKFLNKVHFDSPMCPLELEIYHHMKNVIGVNPSFYEYILQVDADTEVMADSLNRLVSCMIHDGQIIGLCGETQLGNEENSWTTMIQVYEYYISHHLAKAFESLFGSVTCLPGCFCMYRVRTVAKSLPLIISSKVIEEYSDNTVDTLHKKNLLSLGEDRYLTTLMMKHFPQYKMTFTPDAICRTVAPDRWSVLLSQRRRWINSTIHNLAELMFLPEMCGFCCFSMRFIVFLDLFGTLTLPASVIYLLYLIIIVATGMETLPKISLILLGAVYGLQALIFIIKRQWQHIGWMFIYILAIPIFSFFIPVYSFWHFDDFSWGNTRMVVGETAGAKKVVILGDDEEPFDERMIPMKKWSVYEQEMWEIDSVHSHESKGTVVTYRSKLSEAAGGKAMGPAPIPASPMSVPNGSMQGMPSSMAMMHHAYSVSQEELNDTADYYRQQQHQQHQQHQQQQQHPPQFSMQYHHNQGSRSTLGFEEDMRRASISSMPRAMAMVNATSPMAYPGAFVGHGYPSPVAEYDHPGMPQMPTFGAAYQEQPRYNLDRRGSYGGGSLVGVGPYGGGVPMSTRGSQLGSGSVVGAPYDVGFRTHGRSGSTASAVMVSGPVMVSNQVGYGSDQPTDEQLTNEIQNVLATADLMSITKKQVREQLMAFFGVDLTQRKEYINEVIERVLENSTA
ncbi:chitin synthase [Entomortierella parvispora]|uniref:chitin synthase n=1 Tax=Entomortierella parvispora TaxID=205924 RepID=A0A9P3LZE1_9FUNG|nr:chitin synthase [Entomortierella parvispora]